MRRHSDRRRDMPRYACATTTLALMMASAGSSYAHDAYSSGPYARAVVPDGVAAMVLLRIPLGGEPSTRSRSLLGMSVGSSWRNAEGSAYPASRTFSPFVEAGITIGGDPAIRLGPMDLTQRLGRRVHAAEGNGQADGEGWSTGMWVLVGLGVLATAGIVAGAIEESKPHPGDGSDICDAFFNCHY